MSKIYVLHENDDWVVPLRQELKNRKLPFEEWFLNEGHLDLMTPPPAGVFYNRMSASSHTRAHTYAPEYTAAVLSWLETHGRHVINGRRALQLEVSKAEQMMAFNTYGIDAPQTQMANGREALIAAADQFDGPFITKHNRAGKGLGIRLFQDAGTFADYANSADFDESRDGITLLQSYIAAPEPFITRVEFVAGRFLYAVRVDTSEGFELCPADYCQVGDAYCPVGEASPRPKFEIIENFDSPLIPRYERLLAANGIQIAAFEFIRDQDGRAYTYDLNTNTNYNSSAEEVAGISGMAAIAGFLGRELSSIDYPKAIAV